jgi:hypothetical protein
MLLAKWAPVFLLSAMSEFYRGSCPYDGGISQARYIAALENREAPAITGRMMVPARP